MAVRRNFCGAETGALVFVIAAVVAVVCVLVSAAIVWKMTARQMEAVKPSAARATSDRQQPFVEAWSVGVSPAVIHEFALVPGQAGEFFALNADQIYRFDASGAVRAKFAAPSKSTRIATDPRGAIPYLMVVSSNGKWTGAIDHTVTTDYFLHALDLRGQTRWTRRFDPKVYSAPEPLIARIAGRPAVALSASRHIVCLDLDGKPLWDVALWHHPGTVAVADLSSDGEGDLLAAQAPRQSIVRIHSRGQIAGVWGAGDGPSRLRTTHSSTTGFSAVSLRQVFGRGPGVRRALTFFDAAGTTVAEVELPPDASVLSYSPITAMDIDGLGNKVWVVALGDGSIRVFSLFGELLARHDTGVRPLTYLAVPQKAGPDLLIVATNSGITAWRPSAARIQKP